VDATVDVWDIVSSVSHAPEDAPLLLVEEGPPRSVEEGPLEGNEEGSMTIEQF